MKKRKDGRYCSTVTIDGKKHFVYGESPKEVEVNKKQFLLNYSKIQEKKVTGRTFGEIADEWKELHYETLAPNSLKSLKPAVERAIDELGDIPVKEITARHINTFIRDFARQGRAQKTVITQLQAVRQILNYAVNNDELQYNVAVSISIPKNLPKTKRECPEQKIIEKIKTNTDVPFSLFALFALYTGMRRGEILALQYSDIDFKEKQINVSKSVYHISDKAYIKKPKTSAGIRKVVLLPQLEKLIPKMSNNDYIFNDNGKLITNRRFITLWSHYTNALNINITPHQLRHSYATRLYELGIDEKSAQDLLGHADIQTTKNIYTHISEQKRKTTAEQLKDF